MKRLQYIAVITLCSLLIIKEVVAPLAVAALYSRQFMAQVVACDSAMVSSWYIQQEKIEELAQSEVIHMLDCHDYDKTRKIMLMSGLPEDFLSYLGLKALELHQQPAEAFVRQHRFTER